MTKTASSIQLVIFRLGSELYGVDVHRVREVTPVLRITPVPLTRAFIRGVMNLRGRVITVIDLRRRLGLEEVPDTPETRIVVAEVGGEPVGMIVDAVQEVVTIPQEAVPIPDHLAAPISHDCISGLAKIDNQLVIMLDLDAVLLREAHKVV